MTPEQRAARIAQIDAELGQYQAQGSGPDPDKGMLRDIGEGVLSGAASVGNSLLALPTHLGMPDEHPYAQWVRGNINARRDLHQGLGTAGKVAEFGTQVAATMSPAGRVGSLVRGASQGAGLLAKSRAALAPMAEGATSGVMTGEDQPLAHEAGVGAAAGAAGGLLGKVGGGILKGISQSPVAQRLRSEGVPLTLGQGQGGWLERLEQGAERIPIIGGPLRKARAAAYDAYPQSRLESTRLPGQQGNLGGRPNMDAAVAEQRAVHSATPENAPLDDAARNNLFTVATTAQRVPELGKFTPHQFAQQTSREGSPLAAAAREDAALLNRPKPPESSHMVAWGLMGALPFLSPHAGGAEALAYLASKGYSTQTGQKFLSGELGVQKKIADLIKRGVLPPTSVLAANAMPEGGSNAP